MKIRDSMSMLSGNKELTDFPHGGIDILADDGRVLFGLTIKDNLLRIDSGDVCLHGDVMLNDRFSIEPVAANCVNILKHKYEK